MGQQPDAEIAARADAHGRLRAREAQLVRRARAAHARTAHAAVVSPPGEREGLFAQGARGRVGLPVLLRRDGEARALARKGPDDERHVLRGGGGGIKERAAGGAGGRERLGAARRARRRARGPRRRAAARLLVRQVRREEPARERRVAAARVRVHPAARHVGGLRGRRGRAAGRAEDEEDRPLRGHVGHGNEQSRGQPGREARGHGGHAHAQRRVRLEHLDLERLARRRRVGQAHAHGARVGAQVRAAQHEPAAAEVQVRRRHVVHDGRRARRGRLRREAGQLHAHDARAVARGRHAAQLLVLLRHGHARGGLAVERHEQRAARRVRRRAQVLAQQRHLAAERRHGAHAQDRRRAVRHEEHAARRARCDDQLVVA